MIGSRASLVAAGLLIAAADPALAQGTSSGGPMRIGPPGTTSQRPPPQPGLGTSPLVVPPPPSPLIPTSPPVVATPEAPRPAPALTPVPPMPPAPGRILVEPLRPADLDGAGVVAGPADRPFGEGQWDGTPRPLVVELLKRLPAAPASPALRELQIRLLATAARPPAGDGPRLLPLRVEKLAGAGDGLDRLMAHIPANAEDEGVARLRVERLWLGARYDEACADARRQMERSRDPFWQQAQVVCQILGGQAPAAALGAQLLREQNLDDPTFYGLVDLLGGSRGARVDPPPSLSPVHLVLMRQAKREPSPAMLATAAPAVARAIAQSGDYPLPLRAAAAERAAAAGLLTADALAQVYLAAEFQPADLLNPIGFARGDTGARGRALLYRAARGQASPEARAELIAAALQSAQSAGGAAGHYAAAQLYRSMIEALEPSADLGTFTLDAARALFAVDAVAKARAWLDFARRRGALDVQAAAAALRLWPVDRLAGGAAGPGVPAQFQAWAEDDRRRQPASADDRLALLGGLMEANGDSVPATAWTAADTARPAAGPQPPTTAILHLRSAVRAKRPAEAAALILGLAGDRDPAATSPLIAVEIVTALRAMGLEPMARRYAVETALAGL